MSESGDHDDYRTHFENVHCYRCKGTGVEGVLDTTTGIKRVQQCKKCKGFGRLKVKTTSKAYYKSKGIIPGLGDWSRIERLGRK